MDALLNFNDKVVLITGAAQGFGKLLALELAQRGAKIILGDIKIDDVNQVAKEIAARGGEATALNCNVSIASDCKAMVDEALNTYGKIDIAVNNAGVAPVLTPLHLTSEQVMESQFNVNVKGVQMGMRYQIEQMLQQQEGVILNVSSMAGLGGAPLGSSYSAAKHAVIGLTKTGAVEYAKHNIRINAICPYFSLTNMVTDVSDDSTLTKFARSSPMKRLAAPEEIVNTMLLILSPANTYMTGQCIAVDGGVSAI